MRQHRRVRLEPLPRQWLAQFVLGVLRAVERLPFASGRLTFGDDVPVLDVRSLGATHLTADSRYEFRFAGLPEAGPAPYGYATVRSWAPADLTSASVAATNVVAAGDLATTHVEVTPATLGCTVFYHAAGAGAPLADLLWLHARVDVDLDGGTLARATLTHVVATMTLHVAEPVVVDGRWDVAVTLEIRTRWWARPLLALALGYVRHSLRRRYLLELDEEISFEQVVDTIAQAWNDAMPGLTRQSPGRLADQLLADAVFHRR